MHKKSGSQSDTRNNHAGRVVVQRRRHIQEPSPVCHYLPNERGEDGGRQVSSCKIKNLPYMQAVSDGEMRHKRGERQLYCAACHKWVWPDELLEEHRRYTMTPVEVGKAISDQAEKLVRSGICSSIIRTLASGEM